jgi:pimeloyl-ACP methyl ester carboxylesterase
MISSLEINHTQIYYSDIGSGIPVVLLHGYLESHEIWGDFANQLSKYFRVISFDIPGHGKSSLIEKNDSIESIALHINDALEKLNIPKCFMIGHSMGGYITLIFHKLFPEKLSGFSLFHSHPFADSEETKKKRIREVKFVKNGKKDLIAKFNMPNAFANNNLKEKSKEIQNLINIALQTSKNGIIAGLSAMMNRPDLSETLSNSKLPFLLILGKKDNYIDYDDMIQKISLPKNSEILTLEYSGHMGFIEETDVSLNGILHFIKNIEKSH